MNEHLSYTAKAGRLIQWLGVITLAILVILAVASGVRYLVTAQPMAAGMLAALAVGILLSIAYIFIGASAKRHKKWAIALAWVVGIVALFNFPIGTVIGAFVLYYLYKGRGEAAPVVARRADTPSKASSAY